MGAADNVTLDIPVAGSLCAAWHTEALRHAEETQRAQGLTFVAKERNGNPRRAARGGPPQLLGVLMEISIGAQ